MINDGNILAAIFFAGVLPLLTLAFCYWRMVANVLGRTPADARRRARHISLYAVGAGFVSVLYIIAGLASVVGSFASGNLDGSIVAGGGLGLFGVLSAMTLIPVFTVVGQLRRIDRDDQEQLEMEIDRSTGWIERWAWTGLLLGVIVCSLMLGFALIFALAILLLAVPTIAWYRQRNREAQLLWLLALSVRQGRDLATELDRHARTWCGFHACRLRELAMQIKAGRSLATALVICRPEPASMTQNIWRWIALSIAPGLGFLMAFLANVGGGGAFSTLAAIEAGVTTAVCIACFEGMIYFMFIIGRFRGLLPAWCTTAVRVGEQSGTLDVALAECATEHLTWLRDRFRNGSPSGLVFYLSTVLLSLGAIASFIMLFIVPKYKRIFEGFGVDLPEISQIVYEVCDLFAGPLLFVLPGVPLLMLIIVGMDHAGWRNIRFRPFATMYRRFDASGILRHLARTVENRTPLNEGLLALASSHHRPVIATDLAAIVTHVENGDDCWTQLLRRGFIGQRDLAVIESAERSGNLTWALREVATIREQRLQYRIDALLILLRPIMILLMGILVATITIATLMPIVKLMNDLS